jgi:hypothetical protein
VTNTQLSISTGKRFLLQSILSKYQIDYIYFDINSGLLILRPESIACVLDCLLSEFLESGLDETDEPNARGIDLEELIDEINRFDLK